MVLMATDLPEPVVPAIKQMRHAGEIDDHRLAADGLAEAQRQLHRGLGVVLAGEQLAEIDLLARRVRQLDADGVAAGDDGDARRHRAHRAGDVVGQTDDARRLDAGRRLEFVERDHRAGPRIDDLAAHAEIAEHAFQRRGVGVDDVLRHGRALGGALHRQQIQRRQGEAGAGLARGRLRRGGGALARRGRLVLGVFLFFVGSRRRLRAPCSAPARG